MTKAVMFAAGLCAAAAVTTTAAAEQPSAPAEKPKMICKRSTETGSLVAKRKECRTRAEWERMAQEQRASGERLIDDNRPRFGTDPTG